MKKIDPEIMTINGVDYYTSKAIMKKLQITKPTLYKYFKEDLKNIKIGGRHLVKIEDLEEFIKGR